jgi:hypothetical protein
MARVAMGMSISSISGKAGGQIYARNKAGFYIRNAVTVVVPNSERQALIKTRMTVVSQAWANLTTSQRAAWNTYASNVTVPDRMGGRNTISGASMFNRTNMSLLESGLTTLIEDAPTAFYIGEKDETIAVAISEATQNMSITFDNTKLWANEAGGKLLVYQGHPQNPTRNFFAGPWSLAGVISGAATPAPTSPATMACSKPVAEGQKVWLQLRTLRADGRLSDTFRTNTLVGS